MDQINLLVPLQDGSIAVLAGFCSKIYALHLPRVYAISLFAIEYSAKAQPPQHTTTGARGGGGAPLLLCAEEVEPWLNTQMTNRKIAYHTLGRGRAYIFDQKPAKPATDPSCNGYQKIDLAQKPFRLLFPATISLKLFEPAISGHSGQVCSALCKSNTSK